MRPALFIFLVACTSDGLVELKIESALNGVKALEIQAELGDTPLKDQFTLEDDFSFPTSTRVRARQGEGRFRVTVLARDSEQRLLGRGQAVGDLRRQEQLSLVIQVGGTDPACDGIVCAAPPADYCVDANTRRRYSNIPTCESGQCSYRRSDSICPGGCQAGACVGDDPCRDVLCVEPPANSCDGMMLQFFTDSGTCDNGVCAFAKSSILCASECSDGACTGEPCAGISCNQPPAATCAGATMLRVYTPKGTCSQGMCSYTSSDTLCESGCEGGACKNDPCRGITCVQPPASQCASANSLRVFSPSGTCTEGKCGYAASELNCAFGCEAGACKNDPCAGVTCNMPPATTCSSLTTLRTYALAGTCGANGSCNYSPSELTCMFGCDNAACNNDPCAGVSCVTPDAPSCPGPNTLRTYASPGTCSPATGTCSYTSSDSDCSAPANGTPSCSGGACTFSCAAGYTKVGAACNPNLTVSRVLYRGGTATTLGSISGGGLNCGPGSTCTVSAALGSSVTITATGTSGLSYFAGWSGANCTNVTSNSCTITMSQPRTVSARFETRNYVFVTGLQYSNFAGRAEADAICQNEANGTLPGQYVAWLSTNTGPAKDRLPSASGGWYLQDGTTQVAPNKASLLSNGLSHAIDRTAFGALQSGTNNVWTGTMYNGTVPAPGGIYQTCNNWSSYTASNEGAVGSSNATSAYWTYSLEGPNCTTSHRFYCFGVDL